MMKRKTFSFPCDGGLCRKLAGIIQHYTEAAFPQGGSECAQATRESLLMLAEQVSTTDEDSTAEINTRQRALLRGAVNWYFEEIEQDEVTRTLLLEQMKKH